MRFTFLVTLVAILAGCNSSPSPVLPPVELTPLENKINISRQWKFSVGEGVSEFYLKLEPVVSNAEGYVVDHKGELYAFNLASGNKLWQLKLPSSVSGGLSFSKEKLFFGNSKGELVAFDTQGKKVLWRTQLSSEILSSPAVSQGMVIAKTVDGRIYALDVDNGIQQWVYELTVPSLTLRGNSAAIIYNDIVISASASGKLTALSLKQGKVLWQTTIAVAKGRNQIERIIDLDVDPVVVGDVVYLAGYQGRLAAVKIASGEIIWNRDFSSYSGLYVDSNSVYITDDQGQVWAMNRFNGSTLWRQDKLLRRQLTAPQIHGGYLVVGDYAGYLHWLDPDNGLLLARKRLNGYDFIIEDEEDVADYDKNLELLYNKENNILVKPVVIDRLLLSIDRSGRFEAFALEK